MLKIQITFDIVQLLRIKCAHGLAIVSIDVL